MPENIPAQQREVDGVPTLWEQLSIDNNFAVSTSFPQDNINSRMLVLEVIEAPAVKGSAMVGQVIQISDYIAHSVQLPNSETGEIIQAARLVLPQPDGVPVEFISVGAIQSLQRIAKMAGRLPPYDPPIQVKITEVRTRKGFRTLKLVPVPSGK
jgi:Phage Single-stranded DNA-binding protein